MRIELGLLAAAISVVWVLAEGHMAYLNGMFTPSQMLQKYPQHPQGLPFVWHFGMWGDLFIITPIIGVIVAVYSGQWSINQMYLMLGIGMVLSIAMHGIYLMTPFPDSLAWKGGMSVAGFAHVLYMGAAFAIIGLLYFCTESQSRAFMPFVVIVSILLTVHVAIGNHIVLGWLNETHHYPWCPDFIHKPDPWITIAATCIILAVLTGWAVGAQAGISVLMACSFIAALIYMYITKTLSDGTRMGL